MLQRENYLKCNCIYIKKKANTLEEVKRKVTKREDKLFHAINNTYMEFINTNINRIVALELSLLSNKPM
jgi:hypothetical protein